MTPARADLIHRTFEAIAGAPKVIVQLFNSTAPCFRQVVFGKSKEEIIELASTHTALIRTLVEQHREKYGGKFRLVYGVEAFSQTEPEYVVEICTAVKKAWGLAGKDLYDRIMFNLPSTVEISPPNHVTFSLRRSSTAVASSELGVLAGADRVEGCLFGNGERCGNVDLVTLALNLYTQGIPCGLDFSDLQSTIDVVTHCTSLPVHPRHPYAGELVYAAFSGTHQDGIKKGFEAQAVRHAKGDRKWEIPYLPIDPADVGRTYEAVIRVNSQSGKGGIAYIIREHLGIDLPRAVQQEFYQVVQREVERTAQEMTSEEIKATFSTYYHIPTQGDIARPARVCLDKFSVNQVVHDGKALPTTSFEGRMTADGHSFALRGEGAGPLAAFLSAVEARTRFRFSAVETHERESLDAASDDIISFVLLAETQCASVASSSGALNGNGEAHTCDPTWGVGINADRAHAEILAAVSAMNKRLGTRPVSVASEEVMRILNDDCSHPVIQDTRPGLCLGGELSLDGDLTMSPLQAPLVAAAN